ncbi:MAG: serine hydrolase [Woeseia sp.]
MRRILPGLLVVLCAASGFASAQSLDALAEEALSLGDTTSVMVQQTGEVVAEAYAVRMHADRATNIKSASKGIMGLLVGIAIREGYLDGVEQPIGPFFPAYFVKNPEPAKEAITIGDLLSMRSGLESTSRRNYGAWVVSDSWVDYALRQPLVATPGEQRIYSTGNTHLLSAILTEATGMSVKAFAERYLFGPMDIDIGGWDRDPEGYYFGGNNMALSPRSLLKLGELVLDQGRYGEAQLVPAAWIETSLGRYTRSRYNPYSYGYLWWQHQLNGYDIQFAWGNGGQYIMVIPALESVLAITASSDVPGGATSRGGRQQLFQLLGERLFPLLERRLNDNVVGSGY